MAVLETNAITFLIRKRKHIISCILAATIYGFIFSLSRLSESLTQYAESLDASRDADALNAPVVVVAAETMGRQRFKGSSSSSSSPPNCHPDTARVWHHPGSKLAQWAKDYFDWHYDTRCGTEFLNGGNVTTESAIGGGVKYLVIQCLKGMKCGGTADRLQPLPVYIWHAYQMKRIILIQWERPHPLEEFLVPPVGGVNWSTPQWILPHLSKFSTHRAQIINLDTLRQYHTNTDRIITATVQTYAHAILVHYDKETAATRSSNPPYATIFHDTFRAFFTPSPPVAALVANVMTKHNLRPNQFVTAHIRARYPTARLQSILRHKPRTDKEGGLPFATDPAVKNYLVPVAVNAINCAGLVFPNATIYIASDSDEVVNYLRYQSEFAGKEGVELTSLPHDAEPLHLETAAYETRPPKDFYSVFLDLWILGQARCTAYGMGGYGRFGLYMSYDASCSVNHRKHTGQIQVCPSLLG